MSIKKPTQKLKTGTGTVIRYIFCGALFLVPVVYILLSLAILLGVRSNDYSSILAWYSAHWPDAFDVRTMATRCFTPQWYEKLRSIGWIAVPVLGAGLIVYLVNTRRVLRFLGGMMLDVGSIFRFMIRSFWELSVRQRAWLLVLFVAIFTYRLYLYFGLALHPDELCSYLFFVRQGWLVTATSYPLPNNHMLFNTLCVAIDKLGWLSPKAVMRLPSMIGDGLMLYGIFCLFSSRGGFAKAIAVVAGIAFCYFTSIYAVQGRGYQLQEICALISGLAVWECCCGERRHLRRGFALFVVASVAGLYVNPTFLYHFTALGGMVLYFSIRRKDATSLWVFIRGAALAGGLTIVLYLPILLVSSLRAMTDTTVDRTWQNYGGLIHDIADLAYDFKRMVGYGRPGFWIFVGLAVGIFYLYRRGVLKGVFYDRSVVYFFCIGGSLLFWSVLMRQYPMDRTLCFLAVALYIFFVNVAFDLSRRWAGRAAPWVLGGFLVVKGVGSLKGVLWERWSIDRRPEVVIYKKLEGDLEKLDLLHPGSWQITKSDDYYSMYMRLFLIDRGEKARVILNRERAVGEVIFWPDNYPPVIPFKDYVLWGDNRRTAEARTLNIFVSKTLGGQRLVE